MESQGLVQLDWTEYLRSVISHAISVTFTVPFFISLLMVFVFTWILTPLLGGIIVPKSKSFSAKDKSLFNTLASSTANAVVSTCLSTYILALGLMGTSRVLSQTPLGFIAMQFMLGYFISDFIVLLLDAQLRKDCGSIGHHLAGIIGVSLSLFYDGNYMFFIVYRMIAEASTPLVNAFHLLRMTDKKDSHLFIFVSIGMIVVFFAVRILVIPWHWYELVRAIFHPDADRVAVPLVFRYVWLAVNYIMFDWVNVYWFNKMIQGAIKFFKIGPKLAKEL